MARNQKYIDRVVFDAVPETCPHVDAALEEAGEKIKKQTVALRSALTEWVERALNAEDELSDAQDRIKELEREVSDLQGQIDRME